LAGDEVSDVGDAREAGARKMGDILDTWPEGEWDRLKGRLTQQVLFWSYMRIAEGCDMGAEEGGRMAGERCGVRVGRA